MGGMATNPIGMGQAFNDLLKSILGVDLSTPDGIEAARKLPDAEKIRLMDQAFEMVGGTAAGTGLGVTTLGMGAIPAAGAGAVFGRSTSHLLAKGMGLKETPQSVGQEVIDTAKTFAANAAGEGIGRVIPTAVTAGRNVVRNAIRTAVKPTPEGDALKVIADKYGVRLNLGQRSGRPFIQSLETVMDRSPFSTETIRSARKNQFNQYEGAINKWLHQLHSGKISTEEFARLAEDTLSGLQKQFSGRVGAGASAAAKQLSPKPVSNLEAGAALKAGLDANSDTVSKWADKAYSNLRAQHGGREIDVTPLGAAAQSLLDEIPPGQLQNIFPPRALRLLNAANVKLSAESVVETTPSVFDDIAKSQGGVQYVHLDDKGKESVKRIADSMGLASRPPPVVTPATPPRISMSEAMQTRSELLKRASKSTDRNEQRYLYTLADSINDSMESSLSKTPGAEKAFKELQGLNSQYRGYMEKLRPPAGQGRPGSVAAATISHHPIPEQLPPQVSASETMIGQTRAAVSPETTRSIGGMGSDPMQSLRRNRFDSMVESATVVDPRTGYRRTSPTRFAEGLPDQTAMDALYGPQLPPVAGIGKPSLVDREQLLFNDPLPRAVESASGNAMTTYNAAFPKHGFGGRVENTMDIFGEAGRVPQARRGFAEGLLEQSQSQNPTISDDIMLNPRRLERTTRSYGETVPKVLGPQNSATLDRLTTLGKGITETEHRLGNPSGTSRVAHVLGLAGKTLQGPKGWADLAASAKAAGIGSKTFTDPSKYNWMLDPPEKLIPQFGSPVSGSIGRVGTLLALPPKEQSSEDDFGPVVDDQQLGPVVDHEDEFGPIVNAPTQTPAGLRRR